MNRRPALFFLAYLAVILHFSLYPYEFSPYPRLMMLFWVEGYSRRVYLDTILNILFYIPLGGAALLALGRSVPAWITTVLAGTLISLAVELTQLAMPTRYGNLRDLAANCLGTMLGATICYSLPLKLTQAEDWVKRWTVTGPGALFLVLWAVWQAYPFALDLRLSKWSSMWALGNSPAEVLRYALGFYVLARIIGTGSWWLPVAFLAVPGQILFRGHITTFPAMAGALVGWAVTTRYRAKPAVILAALVVWLVVEELGLRELRFPENLFLYSAVAWGTWRLIRRKIN